MPHSKKVYTPIDVLRQPIYQIDLLNGAELGQRFNVASISYCPSDAQHIFLVDLSNQPIKTQEYAPSLGKAGTLPTNMISLASLGFQSLTSKSYADRLSMFVSWVKENGLPVYSAALPFRVHDYLSSTSVSPMVSTLYNAWSFSRDFHHLYSPFFVFPVFALNVLALEACIIYIELLRKLDKLPPIITNANPLKEFMDYGNDKFPVNQFRSDVENIPPLSDTKELQSLYAAFFPATIWDDFHAGLLQKGIISQYEREDEALEKLVIPVFASTIQAYLHHARLNLNLTGKKFAPTFENHFRLIPLNMLGLAWFEFYAILTYTDVSKLKVCRNPSCRSLYQITRSDQEHCSESCRKACERVNRRERIKKSQV